MDTRPPALSVWAGEVVYEVALDWQAQLADARRADAIDDVILALTHDRVYTAGRHADVAHNVLGTRDIRVVDVDRGGDVTYHGPGQIVVYPILRLADPRAARGYVRALEEAMVATAADYGIEARPDDARPGVWVGAAKLGAVGARIDRGVTRHGLAFNVDPDLDDYGGVVACGLAGAAVCSLASLGVETTLEQARLRLVGHLGCTLGRRLQGVTPADLGLSRTTRVRS